MKRKVVLFVGLAGLPLLLGGCFFNVFQTAKTLDQGQVLFGFGLGGFIGVGEETTVAPFYTPQMQFGVGLADGFQLTLQAGAVALLGDEDAGVQFGGASGEFKVRLFDEPDAFALALGFGGGWDLSHVGWGVHGSLYFDSNVPLLPVYFVWRPILSFGGGDGEGVAFFHQFAGGLHLALSETATLLLEADYHTIWWAEMGVLGFGVALLFTF